MKWVADRIELKRVTARVQKRNGGRDMKGPGGLRVAHLITGDLWAGAEVQVAHLLAGLAECQELELGAVLFAEGRLAQELRRSGIWVSVLSEQDRGWPGLVWALRHLLRRHAVDVIHTHGYKESILGALAGRWAGVRWHVKTEHGRIEPSHGWDRLKMSVYRWLDHWVARDAADRVIAVSLDLYRHLTTSLPKGRVVPIRNGMGPPALHLPCRPRRSDEGWESASTHRFSGVPAVWCL